MFYVLFVYGFLLSVIYGGWGTAISDVPETLVLVSAGIFAFSFRGQPVLSREATAIVLFAVAVLALNLATGGIVLGMPPRYSFSFHLYATGVEVAYGQGVTKFFAIAAIMSAYLLSIQGARFRRIILLVLTLVFIGLSLLGGARGDALGLLLTLFVAYFPKAPVKVIVAGVGLYFLGFAILSLVPHSEDLVLYSRMQSVLSGSIGVRETLYGDAWELLTSNGKCFVFGCGFNYFQLALAYEVGMYPHNFLLEYALVWGAPITFIIVSLFALGMFADLVLRRQFDGFFLITVYLTFIFLKSGTVVSGGLFLVGFFYYAARGVLVLTGVRRGSMSFQLKKFGSRI